MRKPLICLVLLLGCATGGGVYGDILADELVARIDIEEAQLGGDPDQGDLDKIAAAKAVAAAIRAGSLWEGTLESLRALEPWYTAKLLSRGYTDAQATQEVQTIRTAVRLLVARLAE